MIEAIAPFADSYLATLAIALVCSYLGLFCVLRRIVFTGVALAQLAAAGVAGAFFVAARPGLPAWLTDAAAQHGATFGSLGAAVLGTIGLEGRGPRSSQRLSGDVRVGLAYAAAGALAVLLVWGSAQGLAELRNILAGEVLLARRGERAALYVGLLAVAVLHAVLRRRFLLVSFDPEFARALKLPVRRLDLTLMLSLAVAVALSLKAGGLLLVFAFLVFPATSGLLLGRRLGESTWLALATATGAAWIGFEAAITIDLPVAPTIACCLLAHLPFAAASRIGPRLAAAVRAGTYLLGGAALLVGLVATVGGADRPARSPAPAAPAETASTHADAHAHEHPHDATDPAGLDELLRTLAEGSAVEDRAEAAQRLEDLADVRALPALVAALGDAEPAVQGAAGSALACLAAQPGVRERLHERAEAGPPDARVLAAVALVRVGELAGLEHLIAALDDAEVPLFSRDLALSRLAEVAGSTFDYDPFGDAEANGSAVARWRRWWSEAGVQLHWDAQAERFVAPTPGR